MKPPADLRALAWVYAVSGFASLIPFVTELVTRGSITLSGIGIPSMLMGRGLLRGSRVWWNVARGLTWLVPLLLVIGLLFHPSWIKLEFSDDPVAKLWTVLSLGFLVWQHRVLNRAEVKEFIRVSAARVPQRRSPTADEASPRGVAP